MPLNDDDDDMSPSELKAAKVDFGHFWVFRVFRYIINQYIMSWCLYAKFNFIKV